MRKLYKNRLIYIYLKTFDGAFWRIFKGLTLSTIVSAPNPRNALRGWAIIGDQWDVRKLVLALSQHNLFVTCLLHSTWELRCPRTSPKPPLQWFLCNFVLVSLPWTSNNLLLWRTINTMAWYAVSSIWRLTSGLLPVFRYLNIENVCAFKLCKLPWVAILLHFCI